MLERSTDQIEGWKADMHTYEKGKRTKKPFGKSLPQVHRVTNYDVKNKQTLFHPILQTYKNTQDQEARINKDQYMRAKSLMNHFKQTKKYERQFDIVNLHSESGREYMDPQPVKKLGPVRNLYNLINNQKLADFHFKNREIKVPVQREMNLLGNNEKDFNIVTNIYHENDAEKKEKEDQEQRKYVWGKYWKTHYYDNVLGKFYDKEKEKIYEDQRKKAEQQHGKDVEKKLPPSYVFREGFISDPTKPLPEALKTLDERKMNAMKKFEKKYIIEDDYGKRNLEDDDRFERIIKNRVHNNRIKQEKAKQFDIVNNKTYRPERAEQLFGKKIVKTKWNKNEAPSIKTGGFNS